MLGEWRVGESHDGLYDVAFWGRDAAEVADALGAGEIAQQGGSLSGWMALSLEDAIARAEELQALKGGEGDRRFAIDVRPHDHAYQVHTQAWLSDTGCGNARLRDAEVYIEARLGSEQLKPAPGRRLAPRPAIPRSPVALPPPAGFCAVVST